ncbi:hypothetical protein EAO70_09410 [Streptomyces sp. adm13(2018)]|nr:hypothetical protein EAO70_09410 [Streptomyces sp. adm13(2018)]
MSIGVGLGVLVVATGSGLVLVLLTAGAAGSLLHAVRERATAVTARAVVVSLRIGPACRIAHRLWAGVAVS